MSTQMSIVPYGPKYTVTWNNFLITTNNGLFIHHRNYMDYHSDRFTDASLLIYNGNNLIGLFPASKKDNVITSHAGLTYGGLLIEPSRGHIVRDMIAEISNYYADLDIVWKCVPSIFHWYPTEAEAYWLTQSGYQVIDEKLSAYISGTDTDTGFPTFIHPNKIRDIKLANKHNLSYVIGGPEHLAEFWNILEDTLAEHHNTKPTHTLSEMQLLQARFPGAILLRLVMFENKIVAGAILYNYFRVVHTQYLASNSMGRKLGALNWLIIKYYTTARPDILNFGHSHERDGSLNWGLHTWKTRFGGAEIALRTYKKEASNVKV